MFAEAVADDAARAASADDAVVAPAAGPEVVDDAVVGEVDAATMLALSGGRSEPDMVENAWGVATLSGAIAKSREKSVSQASSGRIGILKTPMSRNDADPINVDTPCFLAAPPENR